MSYTPPPSAPPPQPATSQPAGKDNTTLYGWIGIVGGICCAIIGIIFGILSIVHARRYGKSPLLGWIALVISALNIIAGIAWNANR